MTICILKHLKNYYSRFTWNELTSSKSFSPQYIHLILAGFVLTNPIFSRDYFLNSTFLPKKKAKIKTRQLLATALCFSWKLVFTSDDVRVRVLIRRVQHDDPVKTVFWFLLWLCRVRSSEKQVVWIASRSGRAKSILPLLLLSSLDKTANNAQSYHWFPREIKSVEWVWKFRTDDASLPRSG